MIWNFKAAYLAAATLALLSITSITHADLATESADDLALQVRLACPGVWEDLGVKIDDGISSGGATPWGISDEDPTNSKDPEDDRLEYSTFLDELVANEGNQPPPVTGDTFTDFDTIRAHCTAARTKLLSLFYSNLPQDVVASMPELTYDPGPPVDGFLVGDIRFTGRLTTADGWLTLVGVQTVGALGSNATHEGPEFKALFEIAKHWGGAHSTLSGSDINWGDHVITLPNMNGRVPAVAPNASYNGTMFGSWNRTLGVANMPKHNHSGKTLKKGAHNHTMGDAGSHSHHLKSSAYTGSSAGGTEKYFEGKRRPNYQNTITHGMNAAPHHKHTLTGAQDHDHAISYQGSGTAFAISQPSMRWMVEVKYK